MNSSTFVSPIALPSSLQKTHSLTCPVQQKSTSIAQKRTRTLRAIIANVNPSESATSRKLAPTTKPGTVSYTSLENNSFVLTYRDVNLLIDPWLYGEIVFGSPKFYRASKPTPPSENRDYRNLDISSISAIILTQGLADHAHPPTLERLPKNIPVVAPPSARDLLTSLKFESVTYAKFGDTIKPLADKDITIKAFKGAKVGPPWSEEQLAVLFSFGKKQPITVYHEPHGVHDENFVKQYRGMLDVLSVPVRESTIPKLGNYSLVRGVQDAVDICRRLLPVNCLPFDNSGGLGSGFLSNYIEQKGGYDKFESAVKKEAVLNSMKVIPPPGPMKPTIIAERVLGEDF